MWALVSRSIFQRWAGRLIVRTGPAHAVYFATYEAVKQAMGGNEGAEHHPLAAGESLRCSDPKALLLFLTLKATSGACATIASDALMNPFDGKILFSSIQTLAK